MAPIVQLSVAAKVLIHAVISAVKVTGLMVHGLEKGAGQTVMVGGVTSSTTTCQTQVGVLTPSVPDML